MSKGTEYSPLKIFHHQERLEQLRRFEQPIPAQVQLIISDLCNHDCSFCLVGGTGIMTPNGEVPIESLVVGDVVTAPDGGINIVTETSKRQATSYLKVKVGSREVCITGNHPILTSQGFKKASEIQIGETAVMSMRVQAAGKSIQRDVELVRERSSTKSWDVCKKQKEGFKVDEAEQPNEEPEDISFSRSQAERCPEEKVQELAHQRSQGSPQKDAIQKQPYEEPRNCAESEYTCAVQDNTVQDGSEIYGLDNKVQPTSSLYRQRRYLDRQKESGLQGATTEEGSGNNAVGMLQRKLTNKAHTGRLWPEFNKALQQQRMAVSSSICNAQVSRQPSTSSEELCIEGIKLERGLVLRPITSIERVEETITVYNFSCSRIQAYQANGVIVHNCAYRQSGYSSNQLFAVNTAVAKFGHNNPIRFIPYIKILEILDDCEQMGIPAIQLTGGGEPSVHKHFEEVLEAVLMRGLDLALVTNGVNLRTRALDSLCSAKWVRFSVDAGTAQTYCRIRGVGEAHWRKVWDNIRKLNELRKDTPHCELIIGVGFVVTRDNYKEVAQCAELARDAGADNIRISAVFQDEGEGYFDSIYTEAKEQCVRAKQLATERFKVFDLFGERIEDLRQETPDYSFCGMQNFVTYIGGDLNVYRCCVLAYNEHGKIGSLQEQRFRDLWESEAKQLKFRTFDATGCPRCMFNNKNRTILYAIDKQPRHVNYV